MAARRRAPSIPRWAPPPQQRKRPHAEASVKYALEFVSLVALLVAWLFPDWVLKMLAAAEAIRRFRRG